MQLIDYFCHFFLYSHILYLSRLLSYVFLFVSTGIVLHLYRSYFSWHSYDSICVWSEYLFVGSSLRLWHFNSLLDMFHRHFLVTPTQQQYSSTETRRRSIRGNKSNNSPNSWAFQRPGNHLIVPGDLRVQILGSELRREFVLPGLFLFFKSSA